jgi:UDP-GlcNAc:undecaprenyl-phosphate GlcNAc-1-phosphate transferase
MLTGWIALVLAGLVGGLVAAWIGRHAGYLGRHLGLLDFPDPLGGRKRHREPTPLVGGAAVATTLGIVGAACWAAARPVAPPVAAHLAGFTLTAVAMYLIGLTDDRFNLSPRVRLLLATLVFALLLNTAPDFATHFLRFTGSDTTYLLGGWGMAFALLCLVGLLNAVNMADGKNGLVISLCLVWSLALGLHAPGYLLPILLALAAALAVTLWFNMHERLFLGDGGSYCLSATFGLLSIYIYNHGFSTMRADQVALLFAVPVFDTIRLMSTRIMKRRSPFSADRDHLHHHLAYRWGWPRGLAIYLSLVAVPIVLGELWPATVPVCLGASLVGYVCVLIVSTRHGHFSSGALRQR